MSPGRPRGGPARVLVVREIRGRQRALVRIVGWSLLEALPSLLSGLVVGASIDQFLHRRVAPGLAILALLLPAAAIGALSTMRLIPWLAELVEPVRDALLTAVVEGAVAAAITSSAPPDTVGVARLTGQVQSVRTLLFGLLRSARRTAFTFLAALAGLFLLAPLAALGAVALVGIGLALFALMLRGLAARRSASLVAGEEVTRRAGAIFAGVRDVVACRGEDRAVADLGSAVETELTATRALSRANALRSVVVFVGGQLPLVLLLATAPWLLRTDRLTFGEVVGAATYLMGSLEPALRSIVGVIGSWGVDLVVTLERIGHGLAAPREPDDEGTGPDRYDLSVTGLTFAYGPQAAPVVRDLSFTVGQGDHLAVVGPSGIGKSTLAYLLAGLVAAQRGVVRVGGVDVARIASRELRRMIAVVPQEAYVFAGTVRENLTYLAPDATADAIAAAVDLVGLRPVVDRLGGLDAGIGAGGADLSHGERQLVALTRVYLSPARIVILDEATANLDPVAEAVAEEAFARRDGTLIVIAHRISSAQRAGRILLLDGDRIHLGTHEELLSAARLYADLTGRWEARPEPDLTAPDLR